MGQGKSERDPLSAEVNWAVPESLRFRYALHRIGWVYKSPIVECFAWIFHRGASESADVTGISLGKNGGDVTNYS